ncbi:hypothetical protein C1H46_007261 [Malus baccata]|uniref:Uncharacterized protein n=1 Tax=Malus baccata TaxID=106549 RepID=A0A540N820_MALBA|nr:hypothetical protein C1H46_007261 [Malus baccata]
MEQVQCWGWLNSRKEKIFNSPSSSSMNSSTLMSGSSSTWEEKAFAEDAAGHGPLGGCIWPPRSYSCSFCMREFRVPSSAANLLAIQKENSGTEEPAFFLSPPFSSTTAATVAPSWSSDNSKPDDQLEKENMIREDDSVSLLGNYDHGDRYNIETDLSMGLNISVVSRSRSQGGSCGEEASMSCKRPKTTTNAAISSSFPFCLQSEIEVTGALVASSMEDLDLELRLGDPPKVK